MTLTHSIEASGGIEGRNSNSNPVPLCALKPAGENWQVEHAAGLPLAGQRRGNATSYPNVEAAARRGVTLADEFRVTAAPNSSNGQTSYASVSGAIHRKQQRNNSGVTAGETATLFANPIPTTADTAEGGRNADLR